MDVLEGYVAFSKQRANEVEGAGCLTPKLFGPRVKYIPFVDSAVDAIGNLLADRNHCPPQAATEQTTLFVLKIVFSAEQVVAAFKAGLVSRVSWPTPGWRYGGDLPISNGTSISWYAITVEPIGIGQWADTVLTKKYNMLASGSCGGCEKQDVATWKSAAKHESQYCAQCWNEYRINKLLGDVCGREGRKQ